MLRRGTGGGGQRRLLRTRSRPGGFFGLGRLIGLADGMSGGGLIRLLLLLELFQGILKMRFLWGRAIECRYIF